MFTSLQTSLFLNLVNLEEKLMQGKNTSDMCQGLEKCLGLSLSTSRSRSRLGLGPQRLVYIPDYRTTDLLLTLTFNFRLTTTLTMVRWSDSR